MLSVLLDPCGTQAILPEAVKRTFPFKKLFCRKFVTLAGVFQGDEAAPHRCYEIRLMAGDPTLIVPSWKIGNQQYAAVRTLNVAHPFLRKMYHLLVPL